MEEFQQWSWFCADAFSKFFEYCRWQQLILFEVGRIDVPGNQIPSLGLGFILNDIAHVGLLIQPNFYEVYNDG